MTDSLSAIHHLVDAAGNAVAVQTDEVYRSSNGDVWQLLREAPTGRIMVRHTPNRASGGQSTESPSSSSWGWTDPARSTAHCAPC